jgi:GT2 family glycosyltransferase
MDVLLVRAPRRGVAAAVNRGIERVETPFLAITHDDARVHREWINCMWSRLHRSPGAVISGTVIPESPRVPSANKAGESVVHTRPLLTRDPLFANNMGTSMEVVHKVGLFDERRELAYAAEDNDWGYRALRAGVPIIHAPDVVVTHLDWRNDQELEETYRRYARAQGAFYGKYLRHGDLFIARRAVRDLIRGPWLVLRAFASPRNQELARMARAEITGILPGIVAGFLSEGRHHRLGAKGDHS